MKDKENIKEIEKTIAKQEAIIAKQKILLEAFTGKSNDDRLIEIINLVLNDLKNDKKL